MTRVWLMGVVTGLLATIVVAQPVRNPGKQAASAAPMIATFSIVARDPATGDYGVAVQSRYFAVGGVVPHAASGSGAVATQARGNLLYGVDGLKMLADGMSAEAVIARLTAADELRSERQVGVVDRAGRAASYTGEQCLDWAGGRTGDGYAVQGNLLAGPQVVDAMATGYETARGEFAERLLSALLAGQAGGGDARGRQSAALLVVRDKGGYLGLNDRFIELHVEDHPTPMRELQRLLDMRLAQVEAGRASELLATAARVEGEARAATLLDAAAASERALARNPADDYSWWSLAKARLALGDRDAAAAAARQALLHNPAWRQLPPSTRKGLGVDQRLLNALLQDEAFRRFWDSLADESAVGS
jgi:uncharacterized Ntn-hydrolase superfamily protein